MKGVKKRVQHHALAAGTSRGAPPPPAPPAPRQQPPPPAPPGYFPLPPAPPAPPAAPQQPGGGRRGNRRGGGRKQQQAPGGPSAAVGDSPMDVRHQPVDRRRPRLLHAGPSGSGSGHPWAPPGGSPGPLRRAERRSLQRLWCRPSRQRPPTGPRRPMGPRPPTAPPLLRPSGLLPRRPTEGSTLLRRRRRGTRPCSPHCTPPRHRAPMVAVVTGTWTRAPLLT